MELQEIQDRIYEIRGHKVLLDFDLALLYETQTKRLKEVVGRNRNRFPNDFMFELTRNEYNALRTQIATLDTQGRGKYSKYTPFAFTEQGVAMLASVLRNDKAIKVNIQIVRAFVFLRRYALSHNELTLQLTALEKKYNKQFSDIFEILNCKVQPKVILIILLTTILFYITNRKNDTKKVLNPANLAVWLGFSLLSTSFFFHDIITDRQGETNPLIPNLGIENLLANEDSTIKDFGNYRIFLFFLMLHVSPHIPWVGSFLDAVSKLYRPFILVPVISTFYTVVLIILGARETGYNEPDIKLYIAIGVAFLVAVNFFYNNVQLSKSPQRSKPPESFEHKINL
ncbi:ORF6N domain-containing protein [Flagellimonas onchidii]|uniref:ORF6N domain-containing protein n=1 Tax=Flagellimonas onchidii TaxID=2562684 RepID=UPI0010A5DFD8|nr:ORF6N domain-containing protein [Allomuricauda onchidii]